MRGFNSISAVLVLTIWLSACENRQHESSENAPFYIAHGEMVETLSSEDGFAYFSGHFRNSHNHATLYVDKAKEKFVIESKFGNYELRSLADAIPAYKRVLGELGYNVPGEYQIVTVDLNSLIAREQLFVERNGEETLNVLRSVSSTRGFAYLTGFSDNSRDHPAIYIMSRKLYVIGQGTKGGGIDTSEFDLAATAYRELLSKRSIPEAY